MGFFPGFGFFASVFWGITLILTGFEQSKRTVIVLFVVGVVIMLSNGMMTYNLKILFYILAIGLPCAVMGIMAAERKGYYLMRKTALLFGIGGTALYWGLMDQQGVWNYYNELFLIKAQTLTRELLQSGALDRYMTDGISAEMLLERFNDFFEMAIHLLPAFCFIQMLLAVYCAITLASIYGLKHGQRWIAKMPLAVEQMPWQLAWGLIAGLFMAFWDYGTGSEMFYAGLNLMCMMAPIGFYYGCAVMSGKYYAYTPEKRRRAVLILFFVCIFVPQMLAVFVVLLGIFDSVINYRHIRIIKK